MRQRRRAPGSGTPPPSPSPSPAPPTSAAAAGAGSATRSTQLRLAPSSDSRAHSSARPPVARASPPSRARVRRSARRRRPARSPRPAPPAAAARARAGRARAAGSSTAAPAARISAVSPDGTHCSAQQTVPLPPAEHQPAHHGRREPGAPAGRGRAAQPQHRVEAAARDREAHRREPERRPVLDRDADRQVGRSPDDVDRRERDQQQRLRAARAWNRERPRRSILAVAPPRRWLRPRQIEGGRRLGGLGRRRAPRRRPPPASPSRRRRRRAPAPPCAAR